MSQHVSKRREKRVRRRAELGRVVGLATAIALCTGGTPASGSDALPTDAETAPSPPVEYGVASGGPFCACTCDVNEDDQCDINDLLQLLAKFGSPPGPGCLEIICDGIIDQRDIGAWRCLFEGLPSETCCDRLVPKWSQDPHGDGEGFNVASDIDWQTLAEQEPGDPGPGPNWVVADDFKSDGRPITGVRWWGSYIDPSFEPPGNQELCNCDLDGNGDCDFNDLLLLLECVGQPPSEDCPADLNCDGIIDEADVDVWVCLDEGNPPDVCCPTCQQPENEIDGWLLSFHTDLSADENPEGFGRPLDLLGLYFAPRRAVDIRRTPVIGWDEHRVYEYRVRFDETHLIHSERDERPGADPPDPARERKFLETREFVYWLDVQAVVGHTYVHESGCDNCECDLDNDGECTITDLLQLLACFGDPGCADLNCDGVTDERDICVWECREAGNPAEVCCPGWAEVPTNQRADDHFWGWHTSPESFNAQSTMGQVVMGPNGEWRYRGWMPVDGSKHEIEDVHNAFDLLTPFCPADIDGDGMVGFSDILEILSNWGECFCEPCLTDLDCDGMTGFSDILFVLSNWGDCF